MAAKFVGLQCMRLYFRFLEFFKNARSYAFFQQDTFGCSFKIFLGTERPRRSSKDPEEYDGSSMMVCCRLNIVKRVRDAFGTFQGRTTKNKLSRRSALNSNIIQTKKERKNKIQVFVYRT